MELHLIQEKIKVPKTQENSFGKYKYRSCEDILEAVKPVLKEFGYALIVTDEVLEIGSRIYFKATAKIFNGTDSYSAVGLARESDDKKGMDSSQLSGATSSYARKYALNGLFAIDDSKDSDYTNTGQKQEAKKPEFTPSHVNWDKAKEKISLGEATIEDLKVKFSVSEANVKLLLSK